MFEKEQTLCNFLIAGFEAVMADIPADRINERAPGNGHPPVWVLGHLAICVEFGEKLLGGDISTPAWLPVFGPGSSDEVANPEQYSRVDLMDRIVNGYPKLCEAAKNATEDTLNRPHGVPLLEGTAVVTVSDLMSHLLTSHIAFHLAQLSTWRRAAGHKALF